MEKKFFLLLVIFQIFLCVSCGSGSESKNEDQDDSSGITADDADDTVSDSDAAENPDSGTDEPAKTAEGCTIFEVDEPTFGSVYKNTYYGDIKDNILGDRTERDVFGIDILQGDGLSHAGTYDLGSGNNKSYLDCTECVRVWQDHDNKTKAKIFFQESGTLVIDTVDAENEVKGTLSAKLVEVTVDPDTREAAKVEGGECIAIENWAFDSGVCIPDCDGKVCGADGCGGTCGEGCSGDLTCSQDQKSCVPYECDKITFDEFKMHINEYDGYYYQASVSGNVIGSTKLEDIMTLHFDQDGYVLKKGTIDLGGDNAQYMTCVECIRLFEDMDFAKNKYGRTFFQQSGELVFEEVKEGTFESKGHASFRLVEVEIDDDTYESAHVPGGACYEIENLTWDTICVPNCKAEDGTTDKICGDDGCGGECGEGCGKDMACSADQTQCVEWKCEKITLGNITKDDASISPYEDIYNYNYPVTPNIGDSAEESLQLRLKNIQEKRPYRLYGSNLRSSDVSFTLYVDNKKMYFQHSGEIVFDPFDFKTGEFTATLDSLRLVEITIDEDFTSTPVPGGGCVEITNTEITYPAK